MNLIGIALKASVVQQEINKKGYLLSPHINQSIHGISVCFFVQKAGSTGVDNMEMFDTTFRGDLDTVLKEILDYVNEQTK